MAGSPTLNPQTAASRARSSKKNSEPLLLRPSPEPGWELWTTTPGDSRETARFDTLPRLENKNLRAIVLPARHLLVFSRWLQTTDESLLTEMVQVILDREGLIPRGMENEIGKSFFIAPILREEQRTLVAIRLLATQVPDDLCQPQVERFELGADLQPLLDDGLTLWRESGQLVAAFSRQGSLLHLQSFHHSSVNDTIAIELFCTRLQLDTSEILGTDFGISLLGDFSAEEISLLQSLFEVAPLHQTPAAPRLPEKISTLTPPLVEVRRQKIRVRERIQRILLGAAALYALLLLTLVAHVAWLTFSNQKLRRIIAENAPTVTAIRSTHDHWRAMESALNPALYPVEVLFQSASLLPEDGVRFTLFEENSSRVTIRGEANNAAAAFRLVDAIKGRADLDYFDWDMPKPTILPNDKAEFSIQGTLPDAPIN